MDAASSSSTQLPDLLVVVKCAYGHSARRTIRFRSSRSCTFALLQSRIESAFALAPGSYTLQYTDDDGEVAQVADDADLRDALQYFYTPAAPHAHAHASAESVSSVAQRTVTLLLDVVPDCASLSLSLSLSLSQSLSRTSDSCSCDDIDSPARCTPQTAGTSASCHRACCVTVADHDDVPASPTSLNFTHGRLHAWIEQQTAAARLDVGSVLEMCQAVSSQTPASSCESLDRPRADKKPKPTRALRELWADDICMLCRLAAADAAAACSHWQPPDPRDRCPSPAFLEYRRPHFSRMHLARQTGCTASRFW